MQNLGSYMMSTSDNLKTRIRPNHSQPNLTQMQPHFQYVVGTTIRFDNISPHLS